MNFKTVLKGNARATLLFVIVYGIAICSVESKSASAIDKQTATTTTTAFNTNSADQFKLNANQLIVDAFKIKLLKLLNVDEVPDIVRTHHYQEQQVDQQQQQQMQPNQAESTSTDSIFLPEPVIKEYNRLVKLNKLDGSGNQLNRAARSRSSPDDAEMSEEEAAIEAEIEMRRLNGSFVQELTLLPSSRQEDTKQQQTVDEDAWCTRYFEESSDQTLITASTLREQGMTLLGCSRFELQAAEFRLNDIKSAELFVKFELDKLSRLLANTSDDDGDDDDTNESQAAKPTAFIYVQVNEKLMNKVDLFELLDAENQDDGEAVFDRYDAKDLLESSLSVMRGAENVLRVRFFAASDLFTAEASASLDDHVRKEMSESVALHVEFGDLAPPAIRNVTRRSKRSTAHVAGSNSSGGRSSKKSPRTKQLHGGSPPNAYRDCGDLRRAGFTVHNYTCCRETISFSIEQLGWSHWILSPKIIEYKYCRGGCSCKRFWKI